MINISIIDYSSCSAAGSNLRELREALRSQRSGLSNEKLPGSTVDTWLGRVAAIDDVTDLGRWQSRNNALALLGLESASLQSHLSALTRRYSSSRIGLVIGSSTSSIDRTELAYNHLHDQELSPTFKQPLVHNPNAPAMFASYITGIKGPSITINTACSSSAKVFATGARWLEAGIVDAVLVGGVDTLCLSVVHGFDSLQLVSANPCRPFDKHRDGINLGEASGFAILTRAADAEAINGIHLTGYGESSDAYHMSHPHPEGAGAKQCIESALSMAGLSPAQIDYINLHGTASRANDDIEGKLISSMFGRQTRCSSTKGWMGHTLGAAGITEAIVAMDALNTGLMPGTLNLETLDDDMNLLIGSENVSQSCKHVLTNSFGFGGNNCSLVFSQQEGH
ncbi:MAG TPA: beta-ketoacyl-ACP synthase [Marinagarivorans sp.]